MISIGGRSHSLAETRAVARLGYPFVEICLYEPQQVEEELPELLRLQQESGITYLAHYPNEDNPLDAGILARRFVPRLQRLLRLSRELGITKGTLHYSMDANWIEPAVLAAKLDLLAALVEDAARCGVGLCLENLSEGYESFVPVFQAIPGLNMTLDIGHAQLLGEHNKSFDFIEHLFPVIRHVHVHDNNGGHRVEDDLHLPLGDGSIDYPAILKELKARGYNSTITMEISPDDMPRTRQTLLECLA